MPTRASRLSRRHVLQLGAIGVVAAGCPLGGVGDRSGGTGKGGPRNPRFEITRITSNDDFYVVAYAEVPDVDAASWRLVVEGLVTGETALSLADIEAMGARDKEHTLQCIDASPFNLAIGNAMWSGLPLGEVLAGAGVVVDAAARFLQVRSADAYLNQLDRSDLDDDRVWLVTKMNGEALPRDHGFPARLLVSGRYGFKNPKWIERITFAADPIVGTWQELGYPDDGANRPAGFVQLPEQARALADAPLDLVGCANCGTVAITSVELSRDEGATWEPAALELSGVPDVWTLWRFPFVPPGPGVYSFLVRVRAADGRASLVNDPGDYRGWQGYGTVAFTIG